MGQRVNGKVHRSEPLAVFLQRFATEPLKLRRGPLAALGKFGTSHSASRRQLVSMSYRDQAIFLGEMVMVEPGSHGNHIETFKMTFPQLEFIQPHALQAFDLLVGAIENQAELPPSQCIPRGGTIAKNPAQPGHCTTP